jgi:transcriptional regulator with XRE-family HTH domain
MTPAELIRKAREAAKLTQGQLAVKLGVSLNTVSRWELGQREPTYRDLLAIATATGHRLNLEMKRTRK